MQTVRAYTLNDMIRLIHERTLCMELPRAVRLELVPSLAAIARRLAMGCDEKVQLLALSGAFIDARLRCGRILDEAQKEEEVMQDVDAVEGPDESGRPEKVARN